jgi:ABC-type iron transport system FetAB permease component
MIFDLAASRISMMRQTMSGMLPLVAIRYQIIILEFIITQSESYSGHILSNTHYAVHLLFTLLNKIAGKNYEYC